jgi:hypothetical protein
MTGGHELNAKVTSLVFRPQVDAVAAGRMASKLPVDAIGARELDRVVLGQHGPTLADALVVQPPKQALGIPASRSSWYPTELLEEPAAVVSGEVYVKRVSGGYKVVGASGKSHEVATMPEVVELVGDTPGAKNQSTAIRFEGFSQDEARGVMRAAEIKTEARFAGVLRDSPEFVTRPLDFSNAKISSARVRSFPDGAGEIGVAVKVPTAGKRPLLFRIKMAFKNASPQWLKATAAKITNAIKSVIAKFSGRAVTPRDVGFELRQQLKVLVPEVDLLEVNLKLEMSDFTIVQLEERARRGAERHAG